MKKFLKIALVIGGIAAVAKLVGAKRSEWEGLTEAEVRAKLDQKLPSRIPADKQAAVADKIVAKMRARGALSEDAAEPQAGGNGGMTVDADEKADS